MTKSWNPKHERKRYDRTGSVVLNHVRLGQAPVSLYKVRWTRRLLWILLVLAVVAGGLAAWLTVDARFYIYDAKIAGNRSLSHEEIFEASGLRGLHILWARSGTIESRILEGLPSIEDVEASCQLPSACSISVVERRPRVLWRDGEESCWIDEQGAVFPVRDDAAQSATELASGEPSHLSGGWTVIGPLPRQGGRAQGHLDDQVLTALNEFWESGRDLPTEFEYASDRGLSFVDERGWRVVVGKGPGMERRLQILDYLVTHLESRGVTPRFVDVRYPDAPYYAPATN